MLNRILGFVYGLLLGNCGYQTDRKIYDQSDITRRLHSSGDLHATKLQTRLLAAARIIRAMQTKYALLLALKIAVMLLMITIVIELEYHIRPLYWRIIKLICFFIEQGLVWIYTFISFGFSLISILLKIALTSASAFCYVFRSFVQTVDFLVKAIIRVGILLITCSLGVLITCSHTTKNKTKSFNPNDSRMGEYIRAISVSYMIVHFKLPNQFIYNCTTNENVVIENVRRFPGMSVYSTQPILNCY